MTPEDQLSTHFKLGEFLAHEPVPPQSIIDNLKKLAVALESVRHELGDKAITIISGYRSLAHNQHVGGAKASTHIQGLGADITVEGMTPEEVYRELNPIWPWGLGSYAGHVHLDIRPYKARWVGKDH